MALIPTRSSGSAEERNRSWRLMTMGWTLVTEIVAGLLLGWLIDWLLGWDKVFVVVGAIVGLLVGMTGFIRAAMKENRRLEQERRASKDADA